MTKASVEAKANAYTRLYHFLGTKHPEILEEFRRKMKRAKDKAIGTYNATMTEEDK